MGVLGEASGVTLDRVLSPAAFAVPARLDGQAGLEHVPFLMWLADALRPGLAVHLAAGAPASCLALCEAVERGGLGTRVYAIGGSEWGTLEAERRRYASFATLIDGSPAGAASRFEDGSVDLLVADANVERGLEALLADWWPKLAGEGVLLVLGTSPPGSDGAAGGWRRLARGRPSFEFVHGGGAVLLVAGEPPEAISPLLSLDEPGQAVVRRVYERLGSALRDRAGLEAAGELADARTRELESELNWAHQAFAARGREASRLAARLVEIETSATWRATRPARAFLARHERLRRLVRPAAKLAWRALVGRRARVGPTALGFAPDAAYAEWIALYDEFGRGDRLSAEAYARRLSFRPLISVVMPVYDTPVDLLEAAIDSVRAQVYENWELCIADNGSRSADVRRLLAEAAESDPRIKLVRLEVNAGISGGSNAAASLAGGEYLGLLDSDDVLRPHALLLVVDELNRHPDAVLVYSDEDKLEPDGRRSDHYFKPDWNPELILAQNYVCHFTVLRRDRFVEVGGFRSEYDGSQDWDLVLRATEGVPPERIRHVPHVLYHWRKIPTSTASRGEAKPYAAEAARRAVESALVRAGVEAEVSTVHQYYPRVRYLVPTPRPRVDVVMPTACKLELLEPCLEGLLRRTAYDELSVTLVVSDIRFEVPEQARFLRSVQTDPRVRLHVYEDRPYNYSWLNNTAAAELDAPLLLLMNDDLLVIHEDWLEVMVGQVLQERVGAVGAKLYYPNETIQHGGVLVGGGVVADHLHRGLPRKDPGYHARAWLPQDLSCVTAAVMLLRREAFDEVGGFDEAIAVAFNDVDLCLRLREAGWRIVWRPDAELYHRESVSLGPPETPERREQFEYEERLMVQRWGEKLLRDPFYNPNLSLLHLNTPSFPPRVDYPWRQGPFASASSRAARHALAR